MKLAHLLPSLKSDIAAVFNAFGVDPRTADGGKTGLKAMYAALDVVSRNRAYDDNHPGFQGGSWKRVLPYDGRPYCFYYEGGADDSHVITLLKRIKDELCA